MKESETRGLSGTLGVILVTAFVMSPIGVLYLTPVLEENAIAVPTPSLQETFESWTVERPREFSEVMSGEEMTLNSLAKTTGIDFPLGKYSNHLVHYVPAEDGDFALCLESPNPATGSVYYSGDKMVSTRTCSLTDPQQ